MGDNPTGTSTRRPRAVAIIDDSRVVRRAIIEALKQADLFDVYHEAEDGAAGIALAEAESLDVVLCDLDMPEVDGFGFLARFRADPKNRNVPVLMLSGADEADKKIQGFSL